MLFHANDDQGMLDIMRRKTNKCIDIDHHVQNELIKLLAHSHLCRHKGSRLFCT